MSLADIRNRLIEGRRGLERRKSEFIGLQAQLKNTRARIRSLLRAGRLRGAEGSYEITGDDGGARLLLALFALQRAQLRTLRSEIAELKAAVAADARAFAAEAEGTDELGLFRSEIPILLLPVRIETKFMRECSQLWVRIYPDEIAVQAHEPGLTDEELDAGKRYRDLLAGRHNPGAGDARKAAWRDLAGRFGAERASWIVKQTARGDGQQKPDSWSEAPRTYVMPDYFTVRLYRQDGTVVEDRGNLIPEPLPVGPAPFPLDAQAATRRFFDEDSAWMADFDRAVDCGMGLRIDITRADFDNGFARVIVVGVKATAHSQKGAQLLTGLINGHRYGKGFSFVRQGTPTNNTSRGASGFSGRDPGAEGSFQAESEAQPLDDLPEKDGIRAARALGIEREETGNPRSDHIFLHTPHAGGTEYEELKPVMKALWPVTWEYFLENMLSEADVGTTKPTYKEPPFGRAELDALQRHFLSFVRGRGPYPAFRVGNMPYGILPATAFTKWEECEADADWIPDDGQVPGLEHDRRLNSVVVQKLKHLYPSWQEMAADPELVPRVGGTMDPEKEFVQMLSMTAGAQSCHMRPVVHELFLWNVIQYIGSERFFRFFLPSLGDAEAMLRQWWQEKDRGTEANENILTGLGIEVRQFAEPVILKAFPWGLGYEWDKPFVGTDFAGYLDFLRSANYADILESAGCESDSLLYNLLRLSILIHEKKKFGADIPPAGASREWVRQSLEEMREAETSRPGTLERALKEMLDLCTHRFDAWVTSFVTKRLESMRRGNREGIYLGAFGWVENLRPSSVESVGYVHAPSLSQAYAGAVLRSAYLSHAGRDKAGLMAVNLTSDRCRRAAWLLEGIRQGQPLGALLGYRFERSLHERYAADGLELDRYISAFRTLYPLKAGKLAPVRPGEAVEAVAAANVVDGEKLLKAWKDGRIPFEDPGAGLPAAATDAYRAIETEIRALDEVMDSVADLALSESVYQCVLGNYDRSGVMLDALGGAAQAPEAEVIKTPRGGFNLKHRVAIVFTEDRGNAAAWGAETATPRAHAEPVLNGWAAGMLGDPERIRFSVSYRQEPLAGEAAVEGTEEVSLRQLITYAPQGVSDESGSNINPFALSCLDVLYLSANAAGELEQRIAYYVRDKYRLRQDSAVTCSFKRHDGWPQEVRSLEEAIEMAKHIQAVLGHSRFLQPSDLFLPEEAEGALEAGFTAQDHDALRARYDLSAGLAAQVKAGISRSKETVASELAAGEMREDSIRSLRGWLFRAAQAGCKGAIPAGAVSESAARGNDLVMQAESVIRELAAKEEALAGCSRRLQETAVVIAELEAAPEGKEGAINDARLKGVRILIEGIKAVFGKPSAVVPGFVPRNRAEVNKALDPSATPVLLDGEDTMEPLLWLQQAAYTHPRLRKLEDMAMLACALSGNPEFPLNVSQLPFKEQDRWLALPFERSRQEREELEQGTVSLVSHMPYGFSAEGGFSGLIVDEWDEQIPHDEETTGVSFHFNRPSNQAPQTVLLAVPPRRVRNGWWSREDLVSIVEETFDLAKIRAVDLDAIKKLGAFLPAVYATVMPDREIVERREH